MTVKPAGILTVGHYYILGLHSSRKQLWYSRHHILLQVLCVYTGILCCRNTRAKAVLCMRKLRNLKVGSMWSKMHGKHVQALHCLIIISPSQRTPCILVHILSFSQSYQVISFVFIYPYTFPFLCAPFMTRRAPCSCGQGLIPMLFRMLAWTNYSTTEVSLLVQRFP